MGYSLAMIRVLRTSLFADWIKSLKDDQARWRIQARIERLISGNPGDVKPVGAGVSELRIDYGPGYRVYFTRRGTTIILLLAGGTKDSQQRDILQAQELARVKWDVFDV